MPNTQLAALVGTARPNFLVLTPACVLVGVAAAAHGSTTMTGYVLLPFAVLGAFLAHVAVNMLNEYEDFRNGLDAITQRTPFSGGSGTLQRAPGEAPATLLSGWLALAGTAAIGLVLVYLRGAALLPLGLLGIGVIVAYSTHIVRWPVTSLIAPGLGFGPLMVMGTAFVISGHYTLEAAVASAVPFFLVNNLLLLNQFPDVEADREVGRSNLPIRVGRRASALVYAGFLAGAFGSIAAGLAAGVLPPMAALALAPAVAAPLLVAGVLRHADDIPRLEPYLGWNVALTLGTIVLLGLGIMLA